jgi:hypothetical protein
MDMSASRRKSACAGIESQGRRVRNCAGAGPATRIDDVKEIRDKASDRSPSRRRKYELRGSTAAHQSCAVMVVTRSEKAKADQGDNGTLKERGKSRAYLLARLQTASAPT